MRRSVKVGVASAGLLLLGSPAYANGDWTSTGNIGIANGNQVYAPIQIPVNACGNALGLLGSASASCTGASAKASYGHGGHGGGGKLMGDWETSNNPGIANGNQIAALVQVPLNLCGNAIGLLGSATASCTGGHATANGFGGDHHHVKRPHPQQPYGQPKKLVTNPAPRKAPELGPIGQLLSPVVSPVIELLEGGYGDQPKHGTCGKLGDWTSTGNIGIANGIQAYAPIQVPINFSGNALGILGQATASAHGTSATAKFC